MGRGREAGVSSAILHIREQHAPTFWDLSRKASFSCHLNLSPGSTRRGSHPLRRLIAHHQCIHCERAFHKGRTDWHIAGTNWYASTVTGCGLSRGNHSKVFGGMTHGSLGSHEGSPSRLRSPGWRRVKVWTGLHVTRTYQQHLGDRNDVEDFGQD